MNRTKLFKKLFSIITVVLVLLSQSPFGSILGTVGTASAATTALAITYPNGGEKIGGTQTITWNQVDDGGGVSNVDILLYKLSTLNYTLLASNETNDGSYSWNTTSKTDGSDYRIKIQRTDLPSLADESDAYFTLDNTPPANLALTSPTLLSGGVSYDIQRTTPTDTNLLTNPIRIEYSENGTFGDTTILTESQVATGPYVWTVPNDDTSAAKLRITATDLAGNASVVTGTAFTIDSTKPVVATGYVTPNPGSGTVNVTIVFTENGAGIDKTLGATVLLNNNGSDYPVTFVIDGSHTSGFQNAANIWEGTIDVSGFANGDTVIKVAGVTDVAGNVMTPNTNAGSSIVDVSGPTFTITEGTDVGPVQTDTINVTVTDTYSSISSTMYGFTGTSTGCASATYSTSFTSGENFFIAGNHTDYLCLKAIDSLGNITYTGGFLLNTDNTAPTLSDPSISVGGSHINIAEKAVGFDVLATSNSAGGTLYVVPNASYTGVAALEAAKIGSQTNAGSGSATTIAITAANAGITGGYDYQVYASDAVGNISVGTIVFTADLERPFTSVSAFPTVNNANSGAVTLGGGCTTIDGNVSISIDDTSGSTAAVTSGTVMCSSSTWGATFDVSSLTDGTLTATATQTDTAGNVTNAGNTKTATKDIVATTNTNTIYTASTSAQSGASVAIVAGDGADTNWFAPAGLTLIGQFIAGATGTTASGDATSILAPATEGTYKLYIIDVNGNVSAESTTTLTGDSSAPTVDVGADMVTNTGVIITGSANGSIAGISGYLRLNDDSGSGSMIGGGDTTANLNITNFTNNGTYTMRLTVTDNAGNTGSDTMEFTWDTIAPTVASIVTTPNPGSGTVNVTVNFTEALAGILTSQNPTVTLSIDGTGRVVNPDNSGTHVNGYSGANHLVWEGTVSIAGLTNGTGTYAVSGAKDIATNTMTTNLSAGTMVIDQAGPDFVINSGTDVGPVQTDTIRVTVSDSNDVSSQMYGFSNNATCDGTDAYDYSFTNGADFYITGNHTDYLCIKGVDLLGNISYTGGFLLNTDNTPTAAPTISTPITTPADDTTPNIGITVTETTGQTIKIYSGGVLFETVGIPISGANTITLSNVGEGVHANFTATFTDQAGNESATVAIPSFIVDLTDPVVTLTNRSYPDETYTNDTTPTFTGRVTDNLTNIASVEYSMNGGGNWTGVGVTAIDGSFDSTSEDYSITLPALADGTGWITVRATDVVGNASTSNPGRYFVVDTTTPTIDNLNVTVNANNTINVVGLTSTTGVTSISQVTYTITGTALSGSLGLSAGTTSKNFNGTIDISGLSTGTYAIYVKAQNVAGTWSTYTSQSFVKEAAGDTEAPTITYVTGTATQTTIAITFNSSESGNARIKYGLTNSYGNQTNNYVVTGGVDKTITMADGLACGTTYHYSIFAKDGSNNEGNLSDATFDTSACTPGDTEAPTITYVTGTATQTTIAITFSSNENGNAWIKYGLTNSYGNQTNNYVVTGGVDKTITMGGLTCGETYHYSIFAKDGSNNEGNGSDATFDTLACTPGDTTDPVLTMIGTIASSYETSDVPAAWTGTANENGTLDINGVQTAYTSGTTITVTLSSAIGSHTYTVRVTDAAGNYDEEVISYNVTADAGDNTAPVLTFNPTSLNSQYTQTAIASGSLTVTSDEIGTLYINGTSQGTINTGVATGITLGTGLGAHSYLVKVVDAAGNNSIEHSFTYNVVADPAGDITAPAFVSSTPSNAATSVSSVAGSVTMKFNENITIADQSKITITKASDNSSVKNGDATSGTDTLTIDYSTLEYNTTYKVTVQSGALSDGTNLTTVDTTIYFTTQTATAPDITNLYLSNLGNTSMKINYTTDVTPDTKNYRVSQTAYNGTRTTMTDSPFTVSGLTGGRTYYYQVKFIKNGQTTYSVPMSFKTATASDGIKVNSIERILNDNNPTPGGDYASGYHFRFDITVNDMSKTGLQFKVADRDASTMQTSGNTQAVVSEDGITDLAGGTAITTGYLNSMSISDKDADANLGGKQVILDMFYKIPATAEGTHSTSYGIKAI